MTTFREFHLNDLYKFSFADSDGGKEDDCNINLYMDYQLKFAGNAQVAESPDGRIIGYMMARQEGSSLNWRSHLNYIRVAPEYRRNGIATQLIKSLECFSDTKRAFYVGVFVSATDTMCIKLVMHLQYIKYCTIVRDGYCNAYHFRKALQRDVLMKSIIPYVQPMTWEEVYAIINLPLAL